VPAYEAWVALDPQANPDAPASPLAMTEYQPPQEQESTDLNALGCTRQCCQKDPLIMAKWRRVDPALPPDIGMLTV
jgi:hypothetical protein